MKIAVFSTHSYDRTFFDQANEEIPYFEAPFDAHTTMDNLTAFEQGKTLVHGVKI